MKRDLSISRFFSYLSFSPIYQRSEEYWIAATPYSKLEERVYNNTYGCISFLLAPLILSFGFGIFAVFLLGLKILGVVWGTIFITMIGVTLWVLRKVIPRIYGMLEVGVGAAVAYTTLGKMDTEGIAGWLAALSAAYLVVRGIDNVARGFKERSEKARSVKPTVNADIHDENGDVLCSLPVPANTPELDDRVRLIARRITPISAPKPIVNPPGPLTWLSPVFGFMVPVFAPVFAPAFGWMAGRNRAPRRRS